MKYRRVKMLAYNECRLSFKTAGLRVRFSCTFRISLMAASHCCNEIIHTAQHVVVIDLMHSFSSFDILFILGEKSDSIHR